MGQANTTEQRQNHRRGVLKRARVVVDGAAVLDCMVENLSPTGARLRLGTPTPLPKVFALRLPDGTSHAARRRWSRGTTVGIAFEGGGPTAEAERPHPAPARDAESSRGQANTTEQRQNHRRGVLKRARVVVDGAAVLDCMVENLSPTGARLRLGTPTPLPKVFALRLSDGTSHAARRRWSRGTTVGIAFEGGGPTAEAEPRHPGPRMGGGKKRTTPSTGDEPSAVRSRETAEAVLRRYGLDAAGLDADELKRRWQELARRHHPDVGGDMRVMQEINAAYSFLKPQAAVGAHDLSSPRVGGVPVWAWAGHGVTAAAPDAMILRNDYSDRNFLKKRLWELSGRSTEEWTLWAFDGQEMLPPVVAYGSDAIFPEMAKAMLRHGRRGFRSPRAILAQPPNERFEALLLRSDGRQLEPPVVLALSNAEGLACDRVFVLTLLRRLDALAGRGS